MGDYRSSSWSSWCRNLVVVVVLGGLFLPQHVELGSVLAGMDMRRLWRTAPAPAKDDQATVHIVIPGYPPAGACMMFLPDGDLEFVTQCGCGDVPRPL